MLICWLTLSNNRFIARSIESLADSVFYARFESFLARICFLGLFTGKSGANWSWPHYRFLYIGLPGWCFSSTSLVTFQGRLWAKWSCIELLRLHVARQCFLLRLFCLLMLLLVLSWGACSLPIFTPVKINLGCLLRWFSLILPNDLDRLSWFLLNWYRWLALLIFRILCSFLCFLDNKRLVCRKICA